MKIKDEIIEFIKNKYAKETEDIIDSLLLLHNALEEVVTKILDESVHLLKDKNFDACSYYSSNAKYLDSICQDIKEYITCLEIDELDEPQENLEQNLNIEEDKLIEYKDIGYQYKDFASQNDLNLENFICISLDKEADFTYHKPLFFELNGEVNKVKNWKDILTQTCDILCHKNPNIIRKYPDIPEVAGMKKKYFSYNQEGFFRPRKISFLNLYIETNLSANAIIRLTRKILKPYKISTAELKIYMQPPK